MFGAGATFGRTTFVSELLGKASPTPVPKLSREANQKADQLIEGHNAAIKTLYERIAQEDQEAAKSPYITITGPHTEAANRLRKMLAEENQSFERQLKLLRE
jgi:rubrerythrin